MHGPMVVVATEIVMFISGKCLGLDRFCEAQTHTLMPTKLLSSTAKTEGYVS